MRDSVLASLLPASVRFAERWTDDPDDLYPEELTHLSRAVPKRRAEFATVRRCARESLEAMGIIRPPMVPGEAGAPTWPTGVVGAMTHCAGYRAAAVASREDVLSLGIDAEPNQPLPGDVLATIALPGEIRELQKLHEVSPEVQWGRLLFSAKESVYKTWYPLRRTWLGFEEAFLRLCPDGTFTAVLNRPLLEAAHPNRIDGAWAATDQHVVTAISLAAPRHLTTGRTLDTSTED